MKNVIRKTLEKAADLVARSPLQHLPMRVRTGPLKGYRWSLAPHSGYWRGVVEQDIEEAIIESKLGDGSVFWDLGAHFGYFSLVMSTFAGSTGQVYCFEPDPGSYARVLRHIRWNKVRNVFPFPFASSDCEDEVPLVQVPGQTSVSHLPYVGEEVPNNALRVKSIRLDDLVAAGKVAKPDFVKVDVEGHGARSLIGAKETIAESRPQILVSMHSERESVGCFELLTPLGYQAFRDKEEVFGPFERGTILFHPQNAP